MSKATVPDKKAFDLAAHVKQLPTKLVENGRKGRERAIMLVVRSVAVVELVCLPCLRVERALPLAGLPSGVHVRERNSTLELPHYYLGTSTLKSSLHGHNTVGLCAGFQSTKWSSANCNNRHGTLHLPFR